MARKFGDRKDAALIRDLDAMHFIMPHIYPGRCDNEAFLSERVDITKVLEYVDKKNENNPELKYTMFHVIVAAVLKLIILRPKLNRFITNKKYYQRNEVSAAFIVKKVFSDNGEEGMAYIRAKGEHTMDDIHDLILKYVAATRKENGGSTEDTMRILNSLPGFVSAAALSFLCWLDRHGWVPYSIIESDPFQASCVLSNLGSIKLHAGYHHLTNWGTTSLFVCVGERKKRPFFKEDGTYEMKESLDIGLTVDERIGDGYYFSKSIRLLKKILENPELLDRPLSEEVELD